MQVLTCTYSPEDNKLRLYSSERLDDETYQRLNDAGFRLAPTQGLFVAPMWTPEREDLLMELCGRIGDEDTSLVERAEMRASRFTEYSDKRAADAESARLAVSAVGEAIPPGQPILVGHHSEQRARKDAERIENGMRRTVLMWETSEYWKERAAGALRHAKYKERPDVRFRRIQKLEADLRKQKRVIAQSEKFMDMWLVENLNLDGAKTIAGFDRHSYQFPLDKFPRNPPASQSEEKMSLWSALDGGIISEQQARDIALKAHMSRIAQVRRWVTHYENRIAYEQAMLGEQGGLAANKFDIRTGGEVLIDGQWLKVKRVNKKAGEIVSVSTNAKYVPVRGIEEVRNYREPSEQEAAQAKAASKLPPMCNYPGEGFRHMTKAEWDATDKDYKGSRELGQGAQRPGGFRPDIKNATEISSEYGRHRVRVVVSRGLVGVYLVDAKRVDPPADQTGKKTACRALDAHDLQAIDEACNKLSEKKREAIACVVGENGKRK